MKLFKKFGTMAVVAGALVLAACQPAPVKSVTKFTDVTGAGTKTLYAAGFVDGSCQLLKDQNFAIPSGGFYDHWEAEGISTTIAANWPTCDAAVSVVTTAADGIIVDPDNASATRTQRWQAVNEYVETLIPEGYDFEIITVQSSGWSDAMIDDGSLNTNKDQWKAYVYKLTYSFDSFDEYKEKTLGLISSETLALSDLAGDDDFATWTVERDVCSDDDSKQCDVVTFTEKSTVLYWSVFDLMDAFYNSEYFTTDHATYQFAQLFSTSDVEVDINGTSDFEYVSEKSIDDEGGIVTLSFTGEFEAPANNTIWFIACGALLAGIAVALFFFLKKK